MACNAMLTSSFTPSTPFFFTQPKSQKSQKPIIKILCNFHNSNPKENDEKPKKIANLQLGILNISVVSIYVNPSQFSPNEDLSTYPSNFEGDIEKLRSVHGGVDVVFNPFNLYDYVVYEGGETMKKGEEEKGEKVISCVESSKFGHETWIRVENLEKGLCGKSRPIFFRGVATVVVKLFNFVEPDVAVFGKKDYQQWRIIQRMVNRIPLDFK